MFQLWHSLTFCEQDIVQKACAHFCLRSLDDDYVLLGDVHDSELELTDDMLKHLPNHGATVTLSRVPHVCNSDEDTHPLPDQRASHVSTRTLLARYVLSVDSYVATLHI